ncbi:MAG: helicase-associated domain-containing protein [Firmicutes bacterium]|nr:hypothetical protein [Alicyclobacillaceae bacterium]MCL6497259.1 helicase-associated domain-containing protein [Bacillota bacterium]
MQLWVSPSLRQILPHLPPTDVRALMQSVGLPPHAALEELIERLAQPERVAAAVETLPGEERQVFGAWLLRSGLIAHEDIHRLPRFASAVNRLAQAGLVFLLRSDYYRPSFVLPAECATPLFEALAPARDADLAAEARTPRPSDRAEEWSPFLHDVFQVVAYADRQPIPITQQHYVYKRAEAKLLSWMWDKRGGEPERHRFAAALQFAQLKGLLTLHGEARELVPTASAAEYWHKPVAERAQDWLQFAAGTPAHQSLGPLLIWLAAGLEPDQWLDRAKLEAFLRARKVRPEVVRQLPEAWARLLAAGAWEEEAGRGRLTDAAYYAYHGRWSPTRPRSAIVQPTGEVLVPPEVPYAERWQWNRLATPQHTDRMWVLQIDRGAVERALDLGFELESYLEAVASLSRTELSPNLVANVRDWFRQLGRHRWVEALILHSQSAEDSAHAERILGALAVRRLSPADLVIRRDGLHEASERLRRAGIWIRDVVETPGLPEPPPLAAAAAPTAPQLVWLGYNQVLVPKLHEALAYHPVSELERLLGEAIRHESPVDVQYFPTGRREVLVETILPTFLNRGWLQGIRLPAKTGVTVHLTQILGLAPAHRCG